MFVCTGTSLPFIYIFLRTYLVKWTESNYKYALFLTCHKNTLSNHSLRQYMWCWQIWHLFFIFLIFCLYIIETHQIFLISTVESRFFDKEMLRENNQTTWFIEEKIDSFRSIFQRKRFYPIFLRFSSMRPLEMLQS